MCTVKYREKITVARSSSMHNSIRIAFPYDTQKKKKVL